jgi:hypothetical protein
MSYVCHLEVAMHKGSRQRNGFIDRFTAFVLMITVSMGTEKGRTAVNRLASLSGKLNLTVKIGFKIILFMTVLTLLFLIKKWMVG